jgi:hypothetical protein
MNRCRGIKPNGEQCTLTVEPPNAYCWHHAPERAEQRRRAASKGGSSKPSREIRDLKQEVKDLIADVKAGDQDRADAGVMLQGYRVLKDYIELERKSGDLDELLERLERLENARRAG